MAESINTNWPPPVRPILFPRRFAKPHTTPATIATMSAQDDQPLKVGAHTGHGVRERC